MKHLMTRKRALALALASVPMLAGCGSNNPTVVGGIGNPLPGNYYPTPGGCIPINQAISFTGTGVQVGGTAGNTVSAGKLPYNGQTFGTVTIGAGGVVTGTSFTYNRQAADGQIGFNVTMANGAPYIPYSSGMNNGTGTLNGVLQISAGAQQAIVSMAGGYGYGNTTTMNVPCVSAIAIDTYVTSAQPYTLYNGRVYLYLNNNQNVYPLVF